MAAYVLLIRDAPVRDAAAMAEYQRLNRANPPQPGLKPLAIYGHTETLEGPAPDGVLILEFPSVAEARAWYDSPAYQAALPHRLQAAECRMMIVEGL